MKRNIIILVLAMLAISCERPVYMVENSGVFKISPNEATLGPEGGVAVSYAEDFTKIWHITA